MMPCSRENWPISECLGVLFGVLGVDWLIDGKARFLTAIIPALAVGALIMIWRRWRRKKRDASSQTPFSK